MGDPRSDLARQQADLLRALSGTAEAPPDFDRGRLAVAAESLARKRAGAVARAWPMLTAELGPDFAPTFRAFAAQHPLPPDGQPLRDGLEFARERLRNAGLADQSRLELAGVELRWRVSEQGLQLRRWPSCRLAWLNNDRALVLAVRVPGVGERWWKLRFRPSVQRGKSKPDAG